MKKGLHWGRLHGLHPAAFPRLGVPHSSRQVRLDCWSSAGLGDSCRVVGPRRNRESSPSSRRGYLCGEDQGTLARGPRSTGVVGTFLGGAISSYLGFHTLKPSCQGCCILLGLRLQSGSGVPTRMVLATWTESRIVSRRKVRGAEE